MPRPIAEQRLLGITSQARAVEIGGEVFLKVVVARPRVPLGAGQPNTILGGVEELLTARQYPLANRHFAVIDHDKNVGTVLKALDHAAARRAEIVPFLIVGNRGGL